MEWVYGKNKRNESALPEFLGHSFKYEEEHDTAQEMEQKTHRVVISGIQTEERIINRMRYPRERMPVRFYG